MKIKEKQFGVLSSGETVDLFLLKAGEIALGVSTYGARIVSLVLPSQNGGRDDIVLGYSTLEPYTSQKQYFGVTVGRFANRIANASFTLDGKTYTLDKNNGHNSLHGGVRGFDRQVWKAKSYEAKGNACLEMTLKSPDGEGGYPGNLVATVTYALSPDGELHIDYRAEVDSPCPVSMTNHSFFNLKGEGKGDILDHELQISASAYLPITKDLIPTGQLAPVAGTPFDFREKKLISAHYQEAGGYDHCFVLDGEAGKLNHCATVSESRSGRTMEVLTTQPGVQLYTGNYIDGVWGKNGQQYHQNAGFCLETQHFPDSPNQPEFPNAIYGPGRKYHEKAVFLFKW